MVTPPVTRVPKLRKHLSADALYARLKESFGKIPDHRRDHSPYPLPDVLLSGLALFALKEISLLAFQNRRHDNNMHTLFGIGGIPCDTQMRTILDGVDPSLLRPAFNDVLRQLQRGKVLERYVFYEGCCLLSLDGTGYFSSQKVHCPCCLEKKSNSGVVTYEHHMLAAVLIHPDQRAVFPLAPEPIQKQDGDTKNDCERNAGKRLLEKIRAEHPHQQFIVVEDGLASNAPHLRLLKELRMHFLVGVKPGDHAFLFAEVAKAHEEGRATTLMWREETTRCVASFVNNVPLNESNQDLLVNYLQYMEYDADDTLLRRFSWVTDLRVTRQNARHFVRGGRSRWKIENETFNTLKNQGYEFEHNFGHGEQHLAVVLAFLMMLAFLTDQIQQHCCPLFKAVQTKLKSKRALWDNLRSHFRHFKFCSMEQLYLVILFDAARELPSPLPNTS